MRAHAGWDQFSCGAAGPVNRGDAPSSAEPAADSRIAALTSAPDTGLTLASKRKASAPERLLGIALHATLQATSAIDGPAARVVRQLRPPYRGDCFRRRALVRRLWS